MIRFLINNSGQQDVQHWISDCWTCVENPSLQDKEYVLTVLGVPEAFYNDIEDVDERPRIEMEQGWTFILVRIPFKNTEWKNPYTTVPLGIVFKDDVFVTISFFKTDLIDDFIHFSRRKEMDCTNNRAFVFRILLSSSVWFLKYLKQINQEIKAAETTLEKSIRNEDLQTLFNIEKSLVYFTTSLRGNDILVHRLKSYKTTSEPVEDELVEDVEIELRQAIETTKIYSDILSGMMDAYASVISNNLNVIMKRLTSISIILMIPTLIASLYGMNVPNSLENNSNGLLYILLVSVIATLIGAVLFRKMKWF